MRYQDINKDMMNRWVADGWEWGVPVSRETYAAARERGEWDIVLTPTKPVPHEWFPPLEGAQVLGLAAGGGQQMPIMAALGAQCTVLDFSDAQIASEQRVAEREGYSIRAVQADMTDPLPFADESFDLIIHPVSNCYVEKVAPIFAEAYRVLKPGGVLLSGFTQDILFVLDDDQATVRWSLPFNPLENAEQRAYLEAEDSGYQFSHSFTDQIGGQLAAGFTLTGLYEDTLSSGLLAEKNIPAFLATRAVK